LQSFCVVKCGEVSDVIDVYRDIAGFLSILDMFFKRAIAMSVDVVIIIHINN
jgi:hypothetical protein